MKTYHYSLKNIFVALAFFALMVSTTEARQSSSFQVLDHNTHEPIIGLIYHYADQKGVSDDNGFIKLTFVPGEILHLSHVNYGKWSLNEEQVQ
ncbi:hypothetical protein [Fontibacter flavus]|uniref:CarboxypepD_reg-like domain-containing protein n=1 Tax=Fontibacter flavus TaxID=654838 RepID=A0ABV6FTJ6_9BACT